MLRAGGAAAPLAGEFEGKAGGGREPRTYLPAVAVASHARIAERRQHTVALRLRWPGCAHLQVGPSS